jgi:hypothetical protein
MDDNRAGWLRGVPFRRTGFYGGCDEAAACRLRVAGTVSTIQRAIVRMMLADGWLREVARHEGENAMNKLLLCATALAGTAAAGTLVLLAGAAAAGGAAMVCCCRLSRRTPPHRR